MDCHDTKLNLKDLFGFFASKMAQASALADSAAHAPSMTDLPLCVSDRLVVASTNTRILILPRVGCSTRFSVLAELFPHPVADIHISINVFRTLFNLVFIRLIQEVN